MDKKLLQVDQLAKFHIVGLYKLTQLGLDPLMLYFPARAIEKLASSSLLMRMRNLSELNHDLISLILMQLSSSISLFERKSESS